MTDYNALFGALTGAANQTARSMPTLGVPAIMAKPIVEAGLAGLGWGAGATKAASEGHSVDPAPSLFHMANIYGLGGPAAGLTSGGAKAAPFFSAAMRAAESAPLKTGANQQWLGWLKNQPGIKQEELDWMGVPEWLSSQPGPVTKQQVTDYIGQNKVDVQEVVKGDALDKFTISSAGGTGGDNWPSMRFDTHEEAVAEMGRREATGRGYHNISMLPPEGSNTKFSQYQLPGGENYRELLLTMPKKALDTSAWKVERSPVSSDPNFSGEKVVVRDANGLIHAEWTVSKGTPDARLIKDAAARTQDENLGAFKSGHYDEPNVLAHVRFNDRVDGNGKKTLFLEEIQSDWHQRGRKEGYKTKYIGRPKEQIERDIESVGQEVERLEQHNIKEFSDIGKAWERHPDLRSKYDALMAERAKLIEYELNGGPIPDAPFKSSWPELSLKRMIKWAADNGYDSVSWTPGKVQAARYDLSKQIDSLKWYRDGDGYRISAKKGDQIVVQKTGLDDNALADHVGKELAEKIVKNEEQHGVMSGLDLQVGGEGMAGFYDKILPNVANKLGKKYGAKVGVSKLAPYDKHTQKRGGEEVWSLPITDAMRDKATKEGFPLFTGGKGGTLGAILNQALTGQPADDNQSSLGDILSRSLKK
jgi:hypothetical protein